MPPKRRRIDTAASAGAAAPAAAAVCSIVLPDEFVDNFFAYCDVRMQFLMGLVDTSFWGGRGWRSLTRLDLSDINIWLQSRRFGVTSDTFPVDTTEQRLNIFLNQLAPHLANVKSIIFVENQFMFLRQQAYGTLFSDSAALALAKRIIPQCTRIEMSSFACITPSPVGELLQLIDRPKIQHLDLQVPDVEGIINFFSQSKPRSLPKLQSLVIGFAIGQSIVDMGLLLNSLSEVTGQLTSITIHTQSRDRSKGDTFFQDFQRLTSKNPNLKSLTLPNESPEALLPSVKPNFIKSSTDVNFELVNRDCLDLFHLPVAKVRLSEGWFNLFTRRAASRTKLGAALTSLWEAYGTVDEKLLIEVTSTYIILNSLPDFQSEPLIHFLASAAEALLDYWEFCDGTSANFVAILSMLDACLSVATRLGLELPHLDALWNRCLNFVRKFPSLVNSASSQALTRLLDSADIDLASLDLSWLFQGGLLGYSTLSSLPPRTMCRILPRYGSRGLGILWQMFIEAARCEAYVPVVVCLLKQAREHPSEGINALNNVLRGINDTFNLELTRILTSLCQREDCFEDIWALGVTSGYELRTFLGFLLQNGFSHLIETKVQDAEDSATRNRIINSLWSAAFLMSKTQKALASNVNLVHDALGSTAVVEEVRRFATGPKTLMEHEPFVWHEKFKKGHIQKALKSLF